MSWWTKTGKEKDMAHLRVALMGLCGLAIAGVNQRDLRADTQRFTPAASGQIQDATTGLVWDQNAASSQLSWDGAKAYCAGKGGGARLPNIRELLSIVDENRLLPSIDTAVFFPDSQDPSFDFWSSTPSASDSSKAWIVKFAYGTSDADSPKVWTHYVRCVR